MYTLLKQVLDKSRIDPQLIEDVCLGNVGFELHGYLLLLTYYQVSNGKAAYIARAASLAAGYPTTAGASSVNRFCSSGLKAVQDVANQIISGSIDIGVAIGAESMSEGGDRLEKPFNEEILKDPNAADCQQPMGQTSENVAKDFEISREAQDQFAAESYQRAERAQKAGWFDDEIVPFKTKVKDPKTGELKEVTLTKDEGPRYGTTFESLSKIRPAFPQYGDRSTGGNSSQVTDGGTSTLTHLTNNPSTNSPPSRRRPPNAPLPRPRTPPTHPCQIRRRHHRRRRPPNNGHRPLPRHPKTPLQIQSQSSNRHRHHRTQRSLRLDGRLLLKHFEYQS